MIKSAHIKNLYSHKDTFLEFHSGLNIIVGTSDSGKSAIKRSIELGIKNRPSGNAMRSHWGGKSLVDIVFDNGSIERNKDKIEEYIVNDTLKLHAFGVSVPEEVVKLANFSDVNIQSQMDSPFLLSATPGEVAAFFNKIANLDKIDRAQQNVEKEIRSLTADIKYKNAEQDKLTEQLSKFDYLEKYEIELEVLEEMETKRDILLKNVSKFVKLFNQIVAVENEIAEYNEILDHEDQVNKILEFYDKKLEIKSELNKINRIVEDYQYSVKQEKAYGWKIELEPALISINKKIDELKSLFLPFVGLNKLLKALKEVDISLEDNQSNLGLLQKAFTKEMGSICLLCGSKI